MDLPKRIFTSSEEDWFHQNVFYLKPRLMTSKFIDLSLIEGGSRLEIFFHV